jgi:uncharacterized membrane protein
MHMSAGPLSSGAGSNAVLARRARGQVMMLGAQFLLGMGVNLIGLPSEASGAAKATTATLLVIHILISVGLIVTAALCLWRSGALDPRSKNQAWIGGILVLITVIAGILTTASDNHWWSFLMAVGFIASFFVYGMLLVGRSQRS